MAQMQAHNEAVQDIAAKVRKFHAKKQKYRIYHGSTNSTRKANFDRDRIIDTSDFTNILSIDKAKMTALVEPNVPLDALVERLQPHGLVPPVVMEFPGITVGGGYSGTSAESSSFRHGLFEQTIVSIEIVLADGTIVHASHTHEPDLLRGAAGAFGTLGVLTLLEIKLIASKPYVELTYHPVRDIDGAIAAFDECMRDSSTDFLDGILYSPSFGVVVQGRMTAKLPSKDSRIHRFVRRKDPWFYLHLRKLYPRDPFGDSQGHDKSSSTAEKTTASSQPATLTEYTLLTDYLFRYDRGAFWTARYAFRYFLFPFNRVTRFVLDPLLHTRVMYRALHASGLAQQNIVQDLTIPVSGAAELTKYTSELGGMWPLWLCPLPGPKTELSAHTAKRDSGSTSRILTTFNFPNDTGHIVDGGSQCTPKPHPHLLAIQQRPDLASERPWLLNIGVWGPLRKTPDYPRRDATNFIRVNRAIEHKIRQLGGVKTLYAHAYYDEHEFNDIYDQRTYNEVRDKYGAGGLPTIFEKVRVNEDEIREAWKGVRGTRPIGGMVGVAKALLGGDYLLSKRSSR